MDPRGTLIHVRSLGSIIMCAQNLNVKVDFLQYQPALYFADGGQLENASLLLQLLICKAIVLSLNNI